MIQIIVVLVVVGVCLYLVESYLPIAQPVKVVIRVVVVLMLCIFLLSAFGVLNMTLPLNR